MDNTFLDKKCSACIGEQQALDVAQVLAFMADMPAWQVNADYTIITRRFEFKNFKQTMFFINAVAFLCEREGHHPDAKFGYNYCEINLSTHSVAGLTENDFIIAHKINHLLDV